MADWVSVEEWLPDDDSVCWLAIAYQGRAYWGRGYRDLQYGSWHKEDGSDLPSGSVVTHWTYDVAPLPPAGVSGWANGHA